MLVNLARTKTISKTGPNGFPVFVETEARDGVTSGWVARITGYDPEHTFDRQFLDENRERETEGGGNVLVYAIESPGHFEADSLAEFGDNRRVFFEVRDGDDGPVVEFSTRSDFRDIFEIERHERERKQKAKQKRQKRLGRIEDVYRMPQLDGSDKQVRWARDIRADAVETLEDWIDGVETVFRNKPKRRERAGMDFAYGIERIRRIQKAKTWIANRGRLQSDPGAVADALNEVTEIE
ncbi:MAG: hypothetical protein ABEN55_20435 [Bradymonadaceae bacterium]